MPTEEYTPLLDRADAVQRATPLIEASSQLLRELVNHACWAFRRCTAASDNLGDENEDTAPFVVYRHLIELVDGIETLFSASCVDAAVPLLRSAFEASLSLDYILQDNYAQRSLSWTCGYVHARIAAHLLQLRGRRGPPEWFRLFDGPANRRQLARVVGREAEYLSLYGEWSNFSHGVERRFVKAPSTVSGAAATELACFSRTSCLRRST